ncbi:MAG: hypothetical protein MUE69_09165 [Myxococcota bacterium]|jgi:hypothetical protein|nr:hypothetical protein [Myxococcota bacterium]
MTTVRRPDLAVQSRVTTPRTTEAPAADRFREALGRSASQLVAGVEQVASFVPGGPVVTAAIRGAAGGTSGVGSSSQGLSSSPETSGGATSGAAGAGTEGSAVGSLADQSNQAMQLLELQHALAMEQQRVQTISNVMKARHDSNKAVIGNLR